MLLTTGTNVFQLFNDDPFITLHKSSQSINVSLLSDLIDDNFPFCYEIDLYHSTVINIKQVNYSIDVQCVINCELLELKSFSGFLSFTFFSLNQGESSFLFLVQYLETAFTFELVRQVVLPPLISFTSPLVFSTIDDVIVSISVLTQCPILSVFHVNNSIVDHDDIVSSFNVLDFFSYSYYYFSICHHFVFH
ncbi:hypothetical protein GEMRC1_009265 [Eukaryota sp. GEM-RC1]